LETGPGVELDLGAVSERDGLPSGNCWGDGFETISRLREPKAGHDQCSRGGQPTEPGDVSAGRIFPSGHGDRAGGDEGGQLLFEVGGELAGNSTANVRCAGFSASQASRALRSAAVSVEPSSRAAQRAACSSATGEMGRDELIVEPPNRRQAWREKQPPAPFACSAPRCRKPRSHPFHATPADDSEFNYELVSSHFSRRREQAALWAARLDGSTLTAADRNALDAWLAENPAHRTLLSSYCQFSADLEQQLPALVAAGTVTMPARKNTPRRNVAWLVVGRRAALVVSAFVRAKREIVSKPSPSSCRRQSVTLADGTKVELNRPDQSPSRDDFHATPRPALGRGSVLSL